MKITLEKAIDLLENADAVVINNDLLVYPSIDGINNDPENEFMFLSHSDPDGLIYSYKFKEGNNQEVNIVGHSMFLIDDEGDSIQLTLLQLMNLIKL